jgi:hypothetical protein
MTTPILDGKIYHMCGDGGYYYIGSTISPLSVRFNNHKYSASKPNSSLAYIYFNEMGWDNIEIKLIEKYPCATRKDLRIREDYHIKRAKNAKDELCLNLNRAHITSEERRDKIKQYYNEHKDAIIEYNREYVELNRDYITKYKKEYRKDNADYIKQYNKDYVKENKEQVQATQKERYEENKEQILAVNRAYVGANKDKVSAYKLQWAKEKRQKNAEAKKAAREKKKAERIARDTEIIQCACGGTYQSYRKSRHDAGKKHVAFVSNA